MRSIIAAIVSATILVASATAFVAPAHAMSCTGYWAGNMWIQNCY